MNSDAEEQENAVEADTAPAYLDPLMEQLGSILEKEVERRGWSFTLNNNELEAKTVAYPDGLLPILLWDASTVYARLTQKTLPMYFFSNTQALCQVSPGVLESKNASFTLFAHLLHASLENFVFGTPEMAKLVKAKHPIPLDALYNNFYNASVEGQFSVESVPILPVAPKIRSGVDNPMASSWSSARSS